MTLSLDVVEFVVQTAAIVASNDGPPSEQRLVDVGMAALEDKQPGICRHIALSAAGGEFSLSAKDEAGELLLEDLRSTAPAVFAVPMPPFNLSAEDAETIGRITAWIAERLRHVIAQTYVPEMVASPGVV